ncbi:alpha/beta fold hydrolase [Amycolatopsis sp. GM8]|uniref:alpha/beta fold hydrolase n=1 Tax=Amycolatopsis sp. GM8 TaxID=2896530 RepID=UPI001F2C8095|nr:alpha/beta fold hydrolase [Amycolatopsis sp. GM8]
MGHGGVPVVLVHGLGSSFERNWVASGWADLLRDEGHEVIGVHLPGHGPAGPEPDAAQRILDVAGEHGAIDAVGFSAGGQAVLRAAARAPEAFRRVAFLGIGDGVLEPRDDTVRLRLADAIEATDPPGDVHTRVFRRMIAAAGNDPAAVAAYLRAVPGPVPAAELRRITAPALVVIGDRDPAGPADRFVAALPDACGVTLRGVDHFATTSDVSCLDAVLKFLSE